MRRVLRALQGLAALRRGEIENCVACLGPSSCIFPIDRQSDQPDSEHASIKTPWRECATAARAYLHALIDSLAAIRRSQ